MVRWLRSSDWSRQNSPVFLENKSLIFGTAFAEKSLKTVPRPCEHDCILTEIHFYLGVSDPLHCCVSTGHAQTCIQTNNFIYPTVHITSEKASSNKSLAPCRPSRMVRQSFLASCEVIWLNYRHNHIIGSTFFLLSGYWHQHSFRQHVWRRWNG